MSDSGYGTAAGSGNATASSTKAYHNGGVEGASFEEWYSGSLEGAYSGTSGSAAPVEQTVLDLSDAGALKILNLGTNPDNGKLMGTVEFLDADGAPVGWGHFWYVDDIKLPETPDAFFYDIGDLEVNGDHGEGKPPKVSLEGYYSTELVTEEEAGDGSGSGSGGTKGSGSGGTKGTGSGGTKGTGSGGTRGTGSGGTKGTGSAEGCSGSIAQQALLPAFAPHPDDAGDLTGEDMIALMTQPIPGSASGGTEGANDWDEALGDALL